MVVKERMFRVPAEEGKFKNGIVIRSGHEFMWEGMMHMSGKTNVGDAVSTLAGRCVLAVFKDRVHKHDRTERLHVERVWPPYDEM